MIHTTEEMERFRLFSRIVVQLLSKGNVNDEEDRELIVAYETDEAIQEMLKTFAEEANLELFDQQYGYLSCFQKDFRSPFAMKRDEFYRESGFDAKTWPVFSFYVFSILSLFFDEEDNQSISLKMIVDFCEEKVDKIKNAPETEQINQKYNWNFEGLVAIWDTLRDTANIETDWDRSTAQTKQGLLLRTVKFLKREGLVEFAPEFQTCSVNKKTEGIFYTLLKDDKYKQIASFMRGESEQDAID
ncbi:MAG: DUF6063 family protein [Thermotogota bacterium]|nr:DUF6063 family protein [Thermotogota bacterium]